MTPEELDEARAKEAWRIYMSHHNEPPKGEDEHRVPAEIAARLARENWTPPEPADPDILAFREWAAELWTGSKECILEGVWDQGTEASAYLAGARMAREKERERAKVLLRGLENIVDADQDVISHMALDAMVKYQEGGR